MYGGHPLFVHWSLGIDIATNHYSRCFDALLDVIDRQYRHHTDKICKFLMIFHSSLNDVFANQSR